MSQEMSAALAAARWQNTLLRKAGDDLYEAVMNSYQAGYLEEAKEAIEAWHDLRVKESETAHSDGEISEDSRG